MQLSAQHAGFRDQQEMLLIISLKIVDHTCLKDLTMLIFKGNPQYTLKDQGIFYNRCSRHMMGNKSFLTDYQEIDEGFVVFGGSPKGGKISRKVTVGNQTNNDAGIEINANTGKAGEDRASDHEYIMLPFIPSKTGIFDVVYDDREVGAEADTNNLELSTVISPIPTIRLHKDHPKEQIIGDLNLSTQIKRMLNFSDKNAMVSYINKDRRTNPNDYQNCLFACLLSQHEPKKVTQALADPS
nr:hypothetical protein [Tanacetum cinerariifolium]